MPFESLFWSVMDRVLVLWRNRHKSAFKNRITLVYFEGPGEQPDLHSHLHLYLDTDDDLVKLDLSIGLCVHVGMVLCSRDEWFEHSQQHPLRKMTKWESTFFGESKSWEENTP